MSLCKLPSNEYYYLNIDSSSGFSTTWVSGIDKQQTAQQWVDEDLDVSRYVPAKWWKFWKPVITFEVLACGGMIDPFYKTVRLQEK